MGRVAAWAAVLLIIAGGLVFALKERARDSTPAASWTAADDQRVAELLADRSQPWWRGHKIPMPAKHVLLYKPDDKMGSFPEPPAGCPVMPVELARGLVIGRANVPSDHPFHGRPVRLIDMRLRSLHLQEHVPDSINVPFSKMASSLASGELKGTDPRTIVILYGDLYPHFEATGAFRVGGFDAFYCLEGGLAAWKAKGYPVISNGPVGEYLRALEGEKVVGGQTPSSDPADVGPAALKALFDQGVDPLVVFVGDENTFKAGHLPKATRVTLEQLPERFAREPKDRLIVVYCGCCEGSAKGLSGIAVGQLRQMKFTRLLHLSGHLKAWKDQGYPLETD
jgi:rhodanese-related sulfurtransferase